MLCIWKQSRGSTFSSQFQGSASMNEIVEWRERAERAEAELAASRETIKRLNRRVQIAEAGVAEKVKASAGRSLGCALANAAADAFIHERDEAMAELAALRADHAVLQ